ncbi:hypothetical protein PVAP13_6NG089006 [Panicum virgatum]|uniref:BED-type domain-containing protein n=1 Tax=Panicum virgatum TaxID=38727 RepID=A0A8T0QWB6_PANVG|nr:hypothetical protein PVAP13_6NG089006 [Panicum virgatum]
MDENYTINDNLKAYRLHGDDEDNLAAGIDDVLLRSSVAASAITTPSSTPSSMPSPSTCTSSHVTKRRSAVWNDFEEIFEDGPNGKKVRVSAKCVHYSHVLTSLSSHGTGHLLRHQKVCLGKVNHANLVQS